MRGFGKGVEEHDWWRTRMSLDGMGEESMIGKIWSGSLHLTMRVEREIE